LGSIKQHKLRKKNQILTFNGQDITKITVQSVSFEELKQIVKIIKPRHTIDEERLEQYYKDHHPYASELIIETIGSYFKSLAHLMKEEQEYAANFRVWVEEPFDLPPFEYCEIERQQLIKFHAYCKKELPKMSLAQQAFLFRLLINVYPPPKIAIEEDYDYTAKISAAVSEKYCKICTDPVCCKIPKSEFLSVANTDDKKSEFCYFMGKEGCKIYEIRPKICRQWDCLKLSDEEFIKTTNSLYFKEIRG
jgi:hypothetical protein